jgi:RNase P subunit RPR2
MISKKEIKDKIDEFFKDIRDQGSEEIKKIKKLGMSINYKLGDLRKRFCQNCYTPLIPGLTCKVRINKGIKTSTCNVCNNKNRWKIKIS